MWEHVTASLRGAVRVSFAEHASLGARSWTAPYLHHAVAMDGCAALGAGLVALVTRYSQDHVPVFYLSFTLALPLIWVTSVALARGYDVRLIGIGADEFRRVGNAGLGLGVVIGIASYIAKAEISRGYMFVALPSVVSLRPAGRVSPRQRLHPMRA